ncbi:MAG TPA: VWA domain-containing protein [Pyrinomonadaceae bacterium]|jgi:VWFA-related protein
MNKQSSLAILLMLSLILSARAQGPSPAPATSPAPTSPQQQGATGDESDDDVVRITSNLVQVDVVVTDSKGNQVTDLGPEDFEVLEDKRQQKITNFSYVSNQAAPARPSTTAPAAANRDSAAPPIPPARLRPEQVRRTIALVVDDLGLSFESAHFTRRALKKFVDEQMQPTDLVAIVRTGSNMGALQQFTSDKRQLYAAIERVRWNPNGRVGISPFEALSSGGSAVQGGEESGAASASGERDLSDEAGQFREQLFTIGTLGALNYIIRGLRDLPGRKSVLLITEGFSIYNNSNASSRSSDNSLGTGRNDRIVDSLRRLTDLANRASVVIYTLDPRGLQTLGLTAQDNTSNLSQSDIETALSDRRSRFFESHDGTDYLARQTGGFSIRNNNDLSGGVRRVLDDQKGYYLIGYRPEESTFDPRTGGRRFYTLSIKVKRPGLRVRTRNGFYGITTDEARAIPRTRQDQLVAALTSPFNANGINLRLTSLFGYDQKVGPFVRSLLHIEGRDLTFTKEAGGWNKAVLDVLLITFGDNGTIVDQINKTYTLRMNKEVYESAMQHGFTYRVNLPVKKAGAYQLRAALRDAASERVGSASQFIEIPDIKKDRVMLSGLIISGIGAGPNNVASASDVAANADVAIAQGADSVANPADLQANPEVRRFKRGMALEYDYLIYNARLDKATARPKLETQVRVFRDGQPIFTGKAKPYDVGQQTDFKRLLARGALQLGTDMPPGEYVLQVIVTDTLAQGKYRTATQWMDFQIQ